MADSGRRSFVLFGILHLVLFVSCIYSANCSGSDGFEYNIVGRRFSASSFAITNNLSFKRAAPLHRHARQAVDAATPTPAAGSPLTATQDPGIVAASSPDALANGANDSPVLPDSTQSGSNSVQATSAPSSNGSVNVGSPNDSGGVENVTASDTASTITTTTTTPTTTTRGPTTTNPFDYADLIHDYHEYYNTQALKNKVDNYYINVSSADKHETLSENHRVAAVIPLKFLFPFYGHPVNNVTVATGGFIYMSPFLHQWLTATQYIAPLMANFDPSLNSKSSIYYLSTEEIFTVEWKDVYLQDQEDVGGFTFQTSLHKNGTISFVYKDIPIDATLISEENHPVKVGLSDAYYNDTIIERIGLRRRTIYEYHQVVLKRSLVRTGAVIFVHPLPTCNTLEDCQSCTSHVDVDFECMWCNTIGRCSDGLDWYRQHWDKYACTSLGIDAAARCHEGNSTLPPLTHVHTTVPTTKKETNPSPTTTSTTTTAPPSTATTTQTPKPTPTPTTTPTPIETTSDGPDEESTAKRTQRTTTTITTTTSTTTTATTSTTTTTPPPSTPTTTSSSKSATAHTNAPSTSAQSVDTTTTDVAYDTNKPSGVKSLDDGHCDSTNQTKECAGLPPPTKPIDHPITPLDHQDTKCKGGNCDKDKGVPVAVIVVCLLLVLGLVGGVGGWVYYAYTHPNSKSGMWLIQHRPSQIKAKIQFWKNSSSSDSGAKYRAETDA